MSALGEAHRIHLCANMHSRPHRCACGETLEDCTFWTRASESLQQLVGVNDPGMLKHFPTTDPRYLAELTEDDEIWPHAFVHPQRFNLTATRLAMVAGSRRLWHLLSHVSKDAERNRVAIENSLLLYEAVRQAHGTPVVVDSTKNPGRLKGLYMADPAGLRALHLVRDGRAVCYSRMKREDLSMAESARIWKSEQSKQLSVMKTMDSTTIMRVRYEDICAEPEAELGRICEWLRLPFSPGMLELDRERLERHSVGGNPMRFRSGKQRIQLDARWRDELSTADLVTFQRIAGKVNQRYGYA